MKSRNSALSPGIDLLDFVERCRHLAKQALGKHPGEPASGGFVRWKHVTSAAIRYLEGQFTLSDRVDDLSEGGRVELGLETFDGREITIMPTV